ncbi:MAG TPA: helix-turn-helix domain-containing protein [Blastocatellia bacterium]|nr:helix-turn-helix domain-containing protein [Blastocatellia bacterium]
MTETKQERPRTEFLTARQLADVLQVSEATVYRLYRSGKIPHIRVTDRILRFHLRDVRHALSGAKRTGDHQEPFVDENQLTFTDLLSNGDES